MKQTRPVKGDIIDTECSQNRILDEKLNTENITCLGIQNCICNPLYKKLSTHNQIMK